ncbi:MAG TPA: endonuclease [Gammaproteobacteria bacterium]|nr:endonuclease [Gammaproteobacteria bacterium]HBF08759.1 endonuclease [Gammaproteobacteria bacterium]HCK93747.1 endonuclease [Gammaproteobacteria bacterium]|tara:strand:- start:19 stop:273 length:255 start_codon:yes stop_codon:yes gene_type:complete
MSTEQWLVYILECGDTSLYTGITNNIARRFMQHKKGTGAKYTRSRLPLKIIHLEMYPDRSTASKRESEIKKLTKKAKRELCCLP